MPMLSEAQRRLMHAVASGKSDKVPKAVAKKYVEHDRGGKLPEKKSGYKRAYKSK
jgi:hypothetical protein